VSVLLTKIGMRNKERGVIIIIIVKWWCMLLAWCVAEEKSAEKEFWGDDRT
jgi:hypothetical protein